MPRLLGQYTCMGSLCRRRERVRGAGFYRFESRENLAKRTLLGLTVERSKLSLRLFRLSLRGSHSPPLFALKESPSPRG